MKHSCSDFCPLVLEYHRFFEQIGSYLQIQDVKIAYFHANKNIFEFLLVGEGSAEFLRILEQEKLGKLEVIQAIDSFYFVRIAV